LLHDHQRGITYRRVHISLIEPGQREAADTEKQENRGGKPCDGAHSNHPHVLSTKAKTIGSIPP